MPDPSDLVAIAERFRVQRGIDWKAMALESLLAVPHDYFRKTLGEGWVKAGQACYCAFQSVQGARTFSLSFTVAGGGKNIVSFESKGAAAGGVESLLGAVDGEVTLEFEGLSLSRAEAGRMGFKTVKEAGLLSNYLQSGRLYAEHITAEPGESGHERIPRVHFYEPAGKASWEWSPVPIPLKSLLPLQSQEQELFAQASTVTVREQHFLGNNRANPSFWSTLTLAKRGNASEASEISEFHEFHYALAPSGTVPMQPHYQQRPQAVFEALKMVVPADKIFMLEVRTV